MDMLLMLFSSQTRQLVTLGKQIISRLDTADERKDAIDYGIEMMKDGKVTVGEWSRFGSKLGILKGPNA
jgi:hypothetical protein